MTDKRGLTPSQTVGPFFHYGLTPWAGDYAVPVSVGGQMAREGATGTRIVLTGRVFDGAGEPVPDAMIEVWQADASGRYAHPLSGGAASNAFSGYGRSDTKADGTYRFETVKPGAVPGPNGAPQAPHVMICVFGRGMLTHLFTRAYFADEPANAADAILALVPQARRGTIIAKSEPGGIYRLDIRLQGDGETVFFDV